MRPKNGGNNVDWKSKTWETEDVLFAQKRKVTNKGSNKRPHFIGSFPSRKNPNAEWITQWESLNERLFYYLLELDPHTVRYYTQPVEVQIPFLNKEGEQGTWLHTPDVLFFRQGLKPYLCQVKESPADITPKMETCNKHSRLFAEKQGWEYLMVYPKMMPEIIKKNLEFLMGCIKKRQGYREWIGMLLRRIQDLGKIPVKDISLSFKFQANPLFINTIVYHMIAIGLLSTDISLPLTPDSFVWPADDTRYYLTDNSEKVGGVLELCSAQSKLQVLSLR